MICKLFSIFKPKIAQKHIRVLVIEDTEVDQRLACAAIEKGGYTSLKANDGKSGFELAKEQKPDLIILDYNLPDIKGPEVCKLLKAHYDTQNIPVLFLTSMTAPDNVINCFEQGENYLAKPISSKLLLKQIDLILKDTQPKNSMLDLKFIRENPDKIKAGLAAKRAAVDVDALLQLDTRRRQLIVKMDDLKAKKNAANDDISRLLKTKQDPKSTIASMKTIAAEVDVLEPNIKALDEQIQNILMFIPNIPHESVPRGGLEANQIVANWGDKPSFSFKPKTHIEIAESLDIIDFKRGTKLSGSNFILYKDLGARLERALYNFMLDLHTSQHGYREMSPPVVVNTASMTATGQLPKMKEDMYHLEGDDLYLIPTAEVPVTNIHRDEMLNEGDLPLYYTAYTTCFRREAGSYGKDTRGLVRVHQFDKVELVKFVKPETSYQELESLLGNARRVFEILKIPYRVLMLASGDLSFAAAKCYDIEVYAAGLDKWLEASSCSNFEDFQARRGNISYKGKDGKKKGFVHTLNGSGVALPRTMVAILENYQTPDGDVIIPEALRSYMGGLERITRR